MARRREAAKRPVLPDPKYRSQLVTKFINCVMKQGKRAVAERIFYGAMDVVASKTGQDPMVTFQKAVDNCRPSVEVRSRRVGGATYQVPVEVRPERRQALAIRWLIMGASGRGERGMIRRLAGEILDAANNQGTAIKKKQDTHRMAEANKAFAHYRW